MKKVITLLALTVLAFSAFAGSEGHDGKALFKKTCAACHQIGKGQLVGPDLLGVEGRYDKEWLYSWIKSSQTMVNEGDEMAVKLFNEHNQLLMPDNAMENEEIDAILAYIALEEEAIAAAAAAPASSGGGASTAAVPSASGGSAEFMDPFMMIIIAAMAVMIFAIFAQNYAVMMLSRRIREGK